MSSHSKPLDARWAGQLARVESARAQIFFGCGDGGLALVAQSRDRFFDQPAVRPAHAEIARQPFFAAAGRVRFHIRLHESRVVHVAVFFEFSNRGVGGLGRIVLAREVRPQFLFGTHAAGNIIRGARERRLRVAVLFQGEQRFPRGFAARFQPRGQRGDRFERQREFSVEIYVHAPFVALLRAHFRNLRHKRIITLPRGFVNNRRNSIDNRRQKNDNIYERKFYSGTLK